MKIIEAMKRVKSNRQKINDLHKKIAQNSAHLSHEKSPYKNPTEQVAEWVQSCLDLSQESARLLVMIAKTNQETIVEIELGGKKVKKSIAEWIWRRREFAGLDRLAYDMLTDRNLTGGQMNATVGDPIIVEIVRNFDAAERDKMVEMFASEPSEIDSALEVVNAVTDLVE